MTNDTKNPTELEAPERVILIIDDDLGSLGIASGYLESCNYTVLVAEDGESGIRRAEYTRPHLILLDIMMPGQDGYEICRRMKGMDGLRDIPVIFMTALADMEHKIRGFEAGGVDYVTKPVQREELVARVGVHLSLRELAAGLKKANESLEQRILERTTELRTSNELLTTELRERKRAEEELRENRDRYRSTLDNMLEGCQILDRDWRYLYVNDAAAKHGRLSKEALLGHTMMEMYHGIEKTDMFAALRRCIDESAPVHIENEFVFSGSNRKWFELSIRPVPEGIFILSIDISERKLAEESLKTLNSNLEEQVRQRIEELDRRNSELERLNRLFIGRELKMVELKKRIAELQGATKEGS